jgi:hypothetical protein
VAFFDVKGLWRSVSPPRQIEIAILTPCPGDRGVGKPRQRAASVFRALAPGHTLTPPRPHGRGVLMTAAHEPLTKGFPRPRETDESPRQKHRLNLLRKSSLANRLTCAATSDLTSMPQSDRGWDLCHLTPSTTMSLSWKTLAREPNRNTAIQCLRSHHACY